MKKLFFFIAFVSSYLYTNGQKVTGCGFKVPPRSLLKTNFQSVYEAKQIINNMKDTIHWTENFSVKEQNGIRNAYATIINKIRWIIYDNNFLEDIDAYASTKWASISVLAHEMGHHYYNHTISGSGSTRGMSRLCGRLRRHVPDDPRRGIFPAPPHTAHR